MVMQQGLEAVACVARLGVAERPGAIAYSDSVP